VRERRGNDTAGVKTHLTAGVGHAGRQVLEQRDVWIANIAVLVEPQHVEPELGHVVCANRLVEAPSQREDLPLQERVLHKERPRRFASCLRPPHLDF